MALKLPLSRLSGRMAFACLLLGTAPAAYAAPLDSILSCRQIEDAQARLACFDAAAATLSQDVETGVVVAVEGVEIEAVERDGFGLNLPSLPRLSSVFAWRGSPSDSAEQPAAREREGALASAETSPDARVVERREDGQIQMIELVIDRVSTHGYNTTRFHMTNDQIWEVTDTMSVNVPRVRRGEVLNAEIRRAGAGGFFLRINGEGRAMRVRRLE
ncbi:hypothetical protein L2D00_02565 [Hyphomonadaceae bacterium BL14]|nr:hypothetical protein L2D00_02565 [Hyphomonadaceae bacterium BL14]